MTAVSHPSGPRILAIVPAWNEEACIAETIAEIKQKVPEIDVLVVDDGSGDNTSARAQAAGAEVARLPFNLGVGGAMRTGYRYALRNNYDVAIQIDADGQHDPAFVPQLIAALETSDIVIGARFAHKGDTYAAKGPRRWAMIMLAWTLSSLAHTRLTDVTSGFRAANRRAIRVFASHYPAEYLGDTVESLVIALRVGCTVQQLPVDMRVRAAGAPSQSPYRAMLYLFRAVVALGLALVRKWPVAIDPSLSPDVGDLTAGAA